MQTKPIIVNKLSEKVNEALTVYRAAALLKSEQAKQNEPIGKPKQVITDRTTYIAQTLKHIDVSLLNRCAYNSMDTKQGNVPKTPF